MNKHRIFIAVSVCLLFCGALMSAKPAWAQAAAAIRQSGQIQRDQQMRQQEDRQRMESQRPPTKLETPAPAVPQGTGTGCFNINRIHISGAAHMRPEQEEQITKEYLNRCLGVNEVQSLLSDITRFYINKGMTTSRAYLPAQDLQSKTLRIEVIEGKVEKLQLQKGDKGSLYLPNAFPGVQGKVLNLRDIEQGVDQLNRLPSNNATIDIAPGTKQGDSVITIRNQPTDRWHLSSSLDNYGTRNTGEQEASATLGLDDMAGINDLLSLTGRRSTSIDTWDRYSNAVNGFYSIPYGYTTFTFSFSYSDYESKLFTAGPTLRLNGNSSTEALAVDHTLWRGQDGKLVASGALTLKQQDNFIADNKLDVSSRPLTILDVGMNYSTTVLGGASSLGFTWSRGLDILDAYKDVSGTPEDSAHAQFTKMAVNASWVKPFQVDQEDLTWSSQFTGQHAFDTLYGTEQTSVGGFYNVRGFYEESLANDNGGYVRNDLTLRKSLGTAWGQDLIAKPYIALDGGAVDGHEGTPHGVILGAGAGAAVTAGKMTFEIFAGHPIMQPDSFGRQGFHTLGRLTIAFQ